MGIRILFTYSLKLCLRIHLISSTFNLNSLFVSTFIQSKNIVLHINSRRNITWLIHIIYWDSLQYLITMHLFSSTSSFHISSSLVDGFIFYWPPGWSIDTHRWQLFHHLLSSWRLEINCWVQRSVHIRWKTRNWGKSDGCKHWYDRRGQSWWKVWKTGGKLINHRVHFHLMDVWQTIIGGVWVWWVSCVRECWRVFCKKRNIG